MYYVYVISNIIVNYLDVNLEIECKTLLTKAYDKKEGFNLKRLK